MNSMNSLKTGVEVRAWRFFAYVIMVVFTLLTVAPLFWLLYSSLKPHAEIIRNIFKLPNEIAFSNYVRSWQLANFGRLIFNSVFYATISTGATVYLALAAGYGFAKFGYRISKLFYLFFTLGLLITAHAVLVPLFVLENWLNINNTRFGVLLPYIGFGLPFMIYLATSYIRGLPNAVEEAAIIDGAGYGNIFHRIIIPMSTPVLATMLIFSFLSNWNEFIFVFVLTSSERLYSLPVGINAFAGGLARNFGLLFAALVIGTIPMILFYIFTHRQLAKGFAAGSLKE